ncbi:hypothetical protein PYW08_009004 [Mythimna loreyi]|uniref:Uncharacterized protein n=1 Tax=Mythimna loreyi TaxID=667449 RepID=A0ACC2Q7W7_9NEOP|nr:hypothetical protein PYW08_009004 [Mythimna loreyi]
MNKVIRTPPSTPRIEVQRAISNPEIADIPMDAEFVNLSQRTKRPRSESSPTDELRDFKEEIRTMLTKWNAKQETNLKSFTDKITKEIAELRSQYEKLQTIKLEIEESAGLINEKYEEINTKMKKLESERYEQRKHIDSLEKQIQDMQEHRRSAVIELRNIPPKEQENCNDLVKTVIDACKPLQITIEPSHIRDIYRVQGKQGPSKQIVAEFHSVTAKNNILLAARNFNKGKHAADKLNSGHIGLKGERVPIYIAERLPARSRQLFYEARKFAKAQNFEYCWSTNGKVFLRKKEGDKSIRINSEKCFHEILHAQTQ